MGIKNLIIFICLSLVHTNNACTTSYCPGNSISIGDPFWLLQDKLPKFCRFPGFNLTCVGSNKTSLYIPNSGEFYVSSIYYSIRTITLSDPDNCLMGRLLTLNLSSSPFKAITTQTYAFLSCPKGSGASFFNIVDCLSNSTTDIVATKYQSDVDRLSMCNQIATLPIPESPYLSFMFGFPKEVDLRWDFHTCHQCSSVKTGEGNSGNTTRIVVFSVVLPVMFALAAIGLCCMRIRLAQESQDSSTDAVATTVTAGLGVLAIAVEE